MLITIFILVLLLVVLFGFLIFNAPTIAQNDQIKPLTLQYDDSELIEVKAKLDHLTKELK